MATNLYLRCVGGRWNWRRRVPDQLVSRFGRRELIRSLGSLPHALAKERARQFTVASDRLFRMVKNSPELTNEHIAELVEDWFRRRLDAKDDWRERHPPRNPDAMQRNIRRAEDRIDGAMGMIQLDDVGSATETAEALLDVHDLTTQPDSPAFLQLRRAILRAEAETARIHAARMRGDFTVTPADPMFAKISKADRKPAKAVPKFSEAWDRYTAEKIHAKAWREDMQRETANTRALFEEWCGDKRLDRYARTDVSDFAGMLQALPTLRGKSPKFTGRTLTELVAMTKTDPTIATLSPKSVKKHTSNVSSFFGWAASQGYVETNFAKSVYRTKRTIRRQDERSAWSVDQLKTLFRSPLYAGCRSTHYRSQPGDLVIKDARYWLPLIGAFHPVRLEEVAQLRVEDVQEESGIWFLNVRGDDGEASDASTPGRKVKSLSAWRRVPLHRIVIELGFLDHIDAACRQKSTMVFDELKPGGTANRYGYDISKWFSRYRGAVGLKGVDFHGFRHSVVTALGRAQVHPDVINRLDGHELPGERGRYTKEMPLPLLKDAIDRISYDGIDMTLIRAGRSATTVETSGTV